VKFFAKSLNIKTKNDIVDARIIAQLAVERKVTLWEPLPPTIAKLKHLSRLNSQLQEQRTSFINMLHSKKHAFDVPKEVVKANQIIIDAITKQIEKVKKLIEKTALENEEISEKINRICQVKGLSILSVATIIAETNGFKFFENVRQLISYAGLDVREFQSGSSINRKTHISKKGNKHIRKILYFPAINVARFENTYNTFYNRINQGKKSKKIGVCAIQRKILILIYTLWKTGENYDPDFNKNRLIAISQCNDLPKDDRTAEGAFYL
jgi:transposase